MVKKLYLPTDVLIFCTWDTWIIWKKPPVWADRLVVGLNSDHSVKILKGEGRPIHGQETRARMLAAMEFIDAVVPFEEETPARLIESVKPDILVKGEIIRFLRL